MIQKLTSAAIRRLILDQSFQAKVGHIGSSLSVVEILLVLYRDILKIKSPTDQKRDIFVLSKGHAGLALFSILYLKGWIKQEMWQSFGHDSTYLGVHPDFMIPGVEFSTGSLGQGFSFAIGSALAAKIKKQKQKTYVLISDAECNEGSVWEGVMFAAQHSLNNLRVIIDVNGQQAFGYTKKVLNLSPLAEKWRNFGWATQVVNGNDEKELKSALKLTNFPLNQPQVIMANTTFGHNVSFMKNQIKWHYLPMTAKEYQQALTEIK